MPRLNTPGPAELSVVRAGSSACRIVASHGCAGENGPMGWDWVVASLDRYMILTILCLRCSFCLGPNLFFTGSRRQLAWADRFFPESFVAFQITIQP